MEARVEFDCAHGTLERPLGVDASGGFDVPGTFTPEGGPTMFSQPDNVRARYTGVVEGDELQLEVLLTDTGQTIGPFQLTRGAPALLRKCL